MKELVNKANFFSQWHQLCRIASYPSEPISFSLSSSGELIAKCDRCGEMKTLAGGRQYPQWSVR